MPVPAIPFRIPPGVRLVRIEAATGLPARPGAAGVILEVFRDGSEPGVESAVIDGSDGITYTGASAVGGKY